MAASLPASTSALLDWTWPQIEPHYRELSARPLSAETVDGWLRDWSRLSELIAELKERLYVATTQETENATAEARFTRYLDEIFPATQAAEQDLKQKLLASGLEPAGFAIPLRNLRAETALFREANLPLLAEEQKLVTEYDKIVGAQTVLWDSRETPLPQLMRVFLEPDRSRREKAWHLAAQRRLADRGRLNDLWQRFLRLRLQIAANAGCGDDYRAYVWQSRLRFDYSPADCETFQAAIEAVGVPAAERVYERRRRRLGYASVRPWDRYVDPLGRPPLHPFADAGELTAKAAAIFGRVDPALGGYFATLQNEQLLDLENRKGKAPGGYCTYFPAARRPFIFMNAVGVHDDVQTLLHEGGHAFHAFEYAALPYYPQTTAPMEFNEVASMAMEFLAAPYLSADGQGFYSAADAARARIEHLEETLLFWPYMAMVDAFQHWVYTHPQTALDPAACEAEWERLWGRFMRGWDWSGLEDARRTYWQRQLHIFQVPFYYVEYGLAQLGAAQIWRNARRDQASAVAAYRRALALGNTVALPELYAAAGARFAFDADTLREAVQLIETVIEQLQAV